MSEILIVEDEAVIRRSLRRLLERHGYAISEAGSVEEALTLGLSGFDLIISDLRLPGAEGNALIEPAGEVPVLIMTSYASVRSAVASMQQGAVDYIAKPFDHQEMVILVQRILDERQRARAHAQLKSELGEVYPVSGMIGRCPAMQAVFARIHKVAPTDTSVLILGESGTGKELVARALHENSQRKNAPIIAVNCAAIPENLVESELFGHERGAFTGAVGTHKGLVEAADGGTLFLDEIGELPLEAQARLLRVLQEGEIRRIGSTATRKVNIRLLAATHRDLRALVELGRFRGDLYYRLNVMEIHLPPLRDRGDDITDLADQLLTKMCKRLNRPPLAFAPPALDAIRAYTWPGNVRELENSIERAVILADHDTIGAESLAIPQSSRPTPPGTVGAASSDELSLDDYFRNFVREHEASLTETEIAKRLGISRKTLWERRQRLGVPRRKEKS